MNIAESRCHLILNNLKICNTLYFFVLENVLIKEKLDQYKRTNIINPGSTHLVVHLRNCQMSAMKKPEKSDHNISARCEN